MPAPEVSNDQVPVVADPPILAPESVIGNGVKDAQVLIFGPAVTVGPFMVTVTVPVSCTEQPPITLVAKILKVVVADKLPVDKLIVPPFPPTALLTAIFVALFLKV